MLRDDAAPKTRFHQWSLEKDIGMTCGGIVRVYFEVFNVTRWNIVVFGAGHVAAALVAVLETLDCRVTCIDPVTSGSSACPRPPGCAADLDEMRVRSDELLQVPVVEIEVVEPLPDARPLAVRIEIRPERIRRLVAGRLRRGQ